MLKEFKKFALKGNVVDMAIGVIVGGAFSTIVNSLVNDIAMPIFGRISSGMDFKDMKVVLVEAVDKTPEVAIRYGVFIQNIVSFLIITFSMFLVVSLISKAKEKAKQLSGKADEAKEEQEKKPSEAELLAEIRDILKGNAENSGQEQ